MPQFQWNESMYYFLSSSAVYAVAARESVAPRANVHPAAPPFRGPNRLESVGSSQACVWGAAPAEYEFGAF